MEHKIKVLERDVQRSILDYLAMKKVFAWRNNSGQMPYKAKTGKEYMIRLGPEGSPDIIGCLPDGRFLAIECKSSEGKVTPEQKHFLDMVASLGGVSFVARSIDDVEKYFAFFEVECG